MNSIDKLKDGKGEIDIKGIKKTIPYENPFLFIDRVLKIDKKNIVAIKRVKGDESFLKGHFKDFPIMPGALIIEGLGQAATMLIRYNIPHHQEKDILAYKVTGTKFFRPTFPGHTLRFEVKLLLMFKKIAFVKGKVFRKDKLVAKVNMALAIVSKKQFRGRYSRKK